MYQVLIVEDEHRLAAFVEKGLRKHGFLTQVVADGEQALEAARSQDYDVILLDLGLPVKDGWAVLRELRKHGDQRPVIVVTAQTDVREQALQTGANDYIAKPFRFRDLLASVQKQLNIS